MKKIVYTCSILPTLIWLSAAESWPESKLLVVMLTAACIAMIGMITSIVWTWKTRLTKPLPAILTIWNGMLAFVITFGLFYSGAITI